VTILTPAPPRPGGRAGTSDRSCCSGRRPAMNGFLPSFISIAIGGAIIASVSAALGAAS
jgi:hypothetical protein